MSNNKISEKKEVEKTNSEKIIYINDNINELKLAFRKEIFQTIMYSIQDHDKIVEKGNGSQIKFADIDATLLTNIYNFIYKKNELFIN